MERLLGPLRPFLLHRVVLLAVKSGVAAGLAWFVGSRLPGEPGQYAYYASLGAISVMYPAVSDSVREAVRATGAILIGAVLATAMQWLVWPNSVTVALIVLVAVALSGLPALGEQRHWVATAALFVLVFSGDPPHEYVLVYVGQIVLGAALGLGVNALAPPLNLSSLSRAVEHLRGQLVRQLRAIARRLHEGDDPGPADLEEVFEEIERERHELRRAVAEVQRSRQGNPRARRHQRAWEVLSDQAYGLARIGFLLQDVGVVLQDAQEERYDVLNDSVREGTAVAFADLATVIERPGETSVENARRSVASLVSRVAESTFDTTEARYLAGVLAASAQLALVTATSRLSGPRPEP